MLYNTCMYEIPLYMQVGDCTEVMYFATKTPQERTEWMEAFKQGKPAIIKIQYCTYRY